MSRRAILFFTDYGLEGPYVGHLHLAVERISPGLQIIDLQHDVPPFRPRGAGILLACQLAWIPEGSVLVAVVDPGVGTQRRGLIVHHKGRALIGPDNGLFAPILHEAERVEAIDWMPKETSDTFHGRDWFAPVGARLASGRPVSTHEVSSASCVGYQWESEQDEVIYIDRFGNLMIGRRGSALPTDSEMRVGPHRLGWARTFAERPVGVPFWHVNALGLVELSVNQGSAAELLGLKVGDPVPICP